MQSPSAKLKSHQCVGVGERGGLSSDKLLIVLILLTWLSCLTNSNGGSSTKFMDCSIQTTKIVITKVPCCLPATVFSSNSKITQTHST